VQAGYAYALTLLLALPAAGLLTRAFILFHDCVHGSLFKSKGANTAVGYLLGVLVFTPFEDWRTDHLRHHATVANLDARGSGDVWTLTRREYETAPWLTRWAYRFFRHPVAMLGLGPVGIFLLKNRVPTPRARRRERLSVLITDLLIAGVVLAAAHLLGWRTYVAIQLPVLWLAGALGIWMFYVQHDFPGVYWARQATWDPVRASMEGSSFYKLPAVLNWFTGSIGYHHVHHLGPRIPNYRLKACYAAVPALQARAALTVAQSLTCVRMNLWDEERQEMVPF
jgi:acyl-lipid omega-6 desaturase (Delta-12 desaturase)